MRPMNFKISTKQYTSYILPGAVSFVERAQEFVNTEVEEGLLDYSLNEFQEANDALNNAIRAITRLQEALIKEAK